MKKILLTFFALSLVLSSCEFGEGFEEMNVDPNKASQLDVSNKFANAVLNTSGSRYENWRASLIYQSTMIQHLSSTASYWSGDKYFRSDQYANALWDRYYPTNIKQIEDIKAQLISEGNSGSEMGMTRILRVFAFTRLTDIYGDIPYSEAGQGYTNGILKPKYDAQQDIYMDMLKELEEAVAQIGASTTMGSSDLIFQGNTTKWKAWGNSMMLRLAMRLTKADSATAKAWAEKAVAAGTMTSNDHIAMVPHTDGPEGINKNGHGEVFDADGNPRMSKTFVDWMKDDPRLPILAARRSDKSTAIADLIGMPNGSTGATVPDTSIYAEPNRNVITGRDAPMVFQTYAEVRLLKAEMAFRGWSVPGDAKTHYEAGVKAAMQMLSQLYTNAAAISDAEVATYLAAKPYDAARGWEMISEQYWAATLLNEYESYNNWRRTGYPTLTPINYDGNVTGGTIPRRLIYPVSEQATNGENYGAAVARQGADNFTTRIWWDK
jgi:hypothetical protein